MNKNNIHTNDIPDSVEFIRRFEQEYPTIGLDNGIQVVNFSSPHSFTFKSGHVLESCTKEVAEKYKVDFIENQVDKYTVELDFKLSEDVKERMSDVQLYAHLCMSLYGMKVFAICPLPMIIALKSEGYNVLLTPFRAIRRMDRKINYIETDKFTI